MLGAAWTCTADQVAICAPKPDVCPAAAACDGTKLVYCGPNGTETIDCTDLGKTACVEDPNPVCE